MPQLWGSGGKAKIIKNELTMINGKLKRSVTNRPQVTLAAVFPSVPAKWRSMNWVNLSNMVYPPKVFYIFASHGFGMIFLNHALGCPGCCRHYWHGCEGFHFLRWQKHASWHRWNRQCHLVFQRLLILVNSLGSVQSADDCGHRPRENHFQIVCSQLRKNEPTVSDGKSGEIG